jgi:folate-dependent phosphoribosylglycinamide formyltransferase PurN
MLTFTRPINVGVLCSRRAPGLVELLDHDPRRGSEYALVCCITSEETFAERERVERRRVPCVAHPFATFRRERGARLADMGARADYDAATVAILKQFAADVVLLDGYLLILTAPLLDAFDGRVINVHHSDLLQRNGDGTVRYPGLRAVRDAFLAGETETRATAHLVTERLDDGPVLARSPAFPVPPVAAWAREREAWDVLKASAWAHQEWMLREAWAPLMANALALTAWIRPARIMELV